uniref:Enhancer of polycomb-like protein n=1 Tax=Setaria digitata TaxID=48799 RepID=A0A915PL68_9BILA
MLRLPSAVWTEGVLQQPYHIGSPTISSNIERFGYGHCSSISTAEFILREKKEGSKIESLEKLYNPCCRGGCIIRGVVVAAAAAVATHPIKRLQTAEEVCLNLLHNEAAETVFNGIIGRYILLLLLLLLLLAVSLVALTWIKQARRKARSEEEAAIIYNIEIMATTSKLSFRARNLDATKSMPVYCADELPDLAECTPINRAVAQMPTGMEKDEENSSYNKIGAFQGFFWCMLILIIQTVEDFFMILRVLPVSSEKISATPLRLIRTVNMKCNNIVLERKGPLLAKDIGLDYMTLTEIARGGFSVYGLVKINTVVFMESHLQEAILAQQASTSGIAVENHVIPTPKVFTVDRGYYDALYPVQPAPSINQLIKVQEITSSTCTGCVSGGVGFKRLIVQFEPFKSQTSLSLGNEEPEYDIDSEDEAWLAERGGLIAESDFEKMMELLEGASSGLQICQPNEARSLLKDFETDLVDDVYDYWLQKRKDAAASQKIASLIPRVKTDARRDASGSDIAYVAFRRRLERMQTRKNRKNDEDSYEKILKLGHDLSRVVILFDMLRRREHTKQTIIGLDDKICKCRWSVCDFSCILYNHILSKVKLERNATMSPTDESQDELSSSMSPTKVKGQKRKRHSRNSVSENDRDLVSRAWLRRNAEMWNKPAIAANVLNAGASPCTVSAADAERSAEAALDGRYTFKRRRGCIYRSSLFSNPPEVPRISPAERFYRTFMPSESGVRCIGYARRRMGRGGRIIFDRVLLSTPSTSQCAPDPPFCSVIDTTKSYQCKLVAADSKDDGDSSSDSDVDRRDWNEEDEREYRRQEELYAKRIFDMSYAGSMQRLQSGVGENGSSSRGTGEQVVVLGEDSNGSSSGNGQNIMSINGVRETDRLRVVNLQQNGPPLNIHARSVSDCGLQPVLLTASVAGKVEKVAPLPNASSVNYQIFMVASLIDVFVSEVLQQKRVHDHSLRIPSQMPLSSETSESSPVFYTHLPPPLTPATGLLAAGEQTLHRPPRTFEFVSSSGMINPAQTLIVTTTQPNRQDRPERQVLTMPSQEVIIGGQSIRSRASGRRRSFASSNMTQLATSLPRPEMNLQRLNSYGFHADIIAQATHCVDTKRLELAIKGSGARIKPSPMIAHSLLQACPPETKTLRDLLLGTGLSTTKTALSNAAVTRTYTAPHYVPVVGDTHRYVPFSNVVTTTSYYVPVTDVSSPGSESMSPPTPHAMSPVVQGQSTRSYFGVSEPKIQTPVAVVSGRPSLNGTQVDTRRSSSAVSKTNGGNREHETLISSPQVGIELQRNQAKGRISSASSPLNATVTAEKSTEGNVVNRGSGNSTTIAATTPTVAEKIYPEPTEAGENTLSNKVASNHRDIAACRGMVNYVIN